MSLVHNEQTKLLANALDRASTACMAAGLIAPAAGISIHSTAAPPLTWATTIGTVIWLLAALALHPLARRILRGLRP